MTTIGMKKRIRIGSWNVRTLTEPSRLNQVCREFSNYGMLILGMCETRWPDSGEFRTSDGLTFLYSGKETAEVRSSGVGLLLSKEARKALIEWKPHSDRILTARFRTRARNLTCIQCYAPTETAEYNVKENFYSTLDRTLSTVQRGDIMILLGDFNAQVGSSNASLEDVMGKHGTGTMNENGELFVEICAKYKLVIGGTLFPHKHKHKITWVSPDQVTENQIDHIAISRTWRGSLLDVRNKRGADISSDHHLLMGTLRLKLAAVHSKAQTCGRRYDVSKLKEPSTARNYIESLRSTLATRGNNNTSDWESIRSTFTDAAATHLGHTQQRRKIWLSDNTWRLIDDRKTAKNLLNAAKTRGQKSCLARKHSDLDRAVKRSARKDKRAYADGLAKQAQAAAETHRIRDLHCIAKKLTNKTIISSRPLKNGVGEMVTSKQGQMAVWSEYYSKMLSASAQTPESICNCQEHHVRNDISTQCPSVPEVEEAIKALKSNKAPGADNISPEMLKADPQVSAQLILPLIEKFWQTECLDKELKEGVIFKIPKKGNLSECGNWRGITLLSMVNKVIAHIITNRLVSALEPELRPQQAGFRPHRSCVDHVNSLRIIVEQSVEWRSPLYLVFIDFEKAFDTLDHTTIWNALACKGTPPKIISLIQGLYTEATCKVLHEDQLSDQINVAVGVRQGCVLSPLLFNIVLDVVMKTATNATKGISWGLLGQLGDLEYADDICLLSHRHSDMSANIKKLEKAVSNAGLKINKGKTKSMRINAICNQPFLINGSPMEDVNSFCYLGSIIDSKGGSSIDINHRINNAKRTYGALSSVWNSSYISRKTKINIFNSNVKSTLLYGCETWNTKSSDLNALQVFTNRCLRRITRIFWPATISNNDLWQLTEQSPIAYEILRRKWNWLGHTLRKPHEDLARVALDWNPQGSRRRGRPAHTWRRQLDIEITRTTRTWNEIKLLALNRSEWNLFVVALCSSLELRD